jgi:2-polyprenyl-3-methyl-5-hydroxy-6-metoxy-1,4-benzoquinol methylase
LGDESTREPQYQRCLDLRAEEGLTRLGLMTNLAWHDDPKHLLFTLSRYKFVAKMLDGRCHVLEVGCADAFGTRIVQSAVGQVTAVDFDPVFVRDAQSRMDPHWRFDVRAHDMLSGPVAGAFDGAYAMDVLEHIPTEAEDTFMANICASLEQHGTLILGTPSLESQVHASAASKAGHVNCKRGPELRALGQRFFHNVFLFSMNDEVVHTGYAPMAHYLLILCCGKRTDRPGA